MKLINEVSKNKSCLEKYRDDVIEFTNKVYSKETNNNRLLDMIEKLQKGWDYKK